ncbi:hypothetical protein FE810_13405 [Thalassotalea litorea]|uniref:Uncharacterized protein n=1 Tax=Thalassotalea litorea TaxID=2020715 RepID=A0A5R9IKE7_9GAMM|nr:hypothetical protein [Thalassotalea litorea]TLU61812.1 hypothetical protein FE810_13405 [Thalassotalea litorea]
MLKYWRNGKVRKSSGVTLLFSYVWLIKVYLLGLLGTLLDFKSNVGTCWRQFVFVGKVKKDTLREYLSNDSIQVG